ncbi:hypothetical protein [Fredinandcohnia quinoae]|uniref:Beta-carotene 15,15'-monooxygenase n=1 Tax=Fredinandcohnia quinoae TaxID=2918902 RepID=A0AAW5ECW7_9BACI|nr:hypothetical protein [Fredinandcohnia sp. SECRCQ15]MCH1626604.1 hypothetical protein [Fredinandcohnia sp. SECRCQ15]
MNLLHGLYNTILHPRLIIIPLLMNVLLTLLVVLGIYFGYSLSPFPPIQINHFIGVNGTFPFWMPFLDDIHLPFKYSNNNALSDNTLLSITAILLVLLLKSYALSMYLGSIKCFLIGPDNTYSILKIGKYYFKRMVLFSAIELTVGGLLIFLNLTFWPSVFITLILLLFFSLAPYIIVVEDISVIEALKKSSVIFKRNFLYLLLLAFSCILFTFSLTLLEFRVNGLNFYYILITYCFFGTAAIYAVMAIIHQSVNKDIKLPFKKVKKSRLYYPLLIIVVFVLPLLGALLIT